MSGLVYGEFVLSITSKGSRRLVQLHKDGSYWGGIRHKDVVERGSHCFQINGTTFRRPTLQEYTLLMKRVPTPSYPKDALTIVSMLDVGSGSRVLEAGTGSGAMTLYLSKDGMQPSDALCINQCILSSGSASRVV
jgi:tRNA (adenine57-N1/adenine58-N1)-methyltransferase